MNVLEKDIASTEYIDAFLDDIEQEQTARRFVEEIKLQLEMEARAQPAATEAKKHPFLAADAELIEADVRQIAALKRQEVSQRAQESGLIDEDYQNDVIGYHRRVIDMRNNGASEAEVKEMETRAWYQTATSIVEKFYALAEDAPEPQRYLVHPETGKIMDGNQEFTEMLINGLSGTSAPVEHERRIHEAVNVAVIERAAQYEHVEEVAFIEHSFANLVDGGDGYVSEIDKMQIRYMYFERDEDDGNLYLVLEPIYVDGRAIDESLIGQANRDFEVEDIAEFLRDKGERVEPHEIVELLGVEPISSDRTDLLGEMRMVRREKVPSVVEYMGLVDWALSSATGVQHYLGKEVTEDTEIRYDQIYEVTTKRHEELQKVIKTVNDRAYLLAERNTERVVAEDYILSLQKRLALKEGKDNYDLAVSAFSVDTANKLREIKKMEDAGMSQTDVDAKIDILQNEAEDLRGCDGEGCKLELANTDDVLRASAAGLKPYSNGEFYRDHKAQCPICGYKGILRGSNGAICLNSACKSDVVNGKVTDRFNKKEADSKEPATQELDDEPEFSIDANPVEQEKAEDTLQTRKSTNSAL